VVGAASGPKLPIGDLVTNTMLTLDIDKDAPGKAPADYAIVGKPVPRLDIPDKIFARFTFMQDFTIPGMLHGRVVRPSGFGAAHASLAAAPRQLSATYYFARHTHGSIGPSCAVASFADGKLTCWTASQAVHDLRRQLAAMLAVSDADIRCIYVEGAGCYGRN